MKNQRRYYSEVTLKKHIPKITESFLILLCIFLIFFSSRAAEHAREALSVCALSIVPSLFPCMVVSRMLLQSGGGTISGRILPISRLFGLPGAASAPILLGLLCGFPVGAKSAAELYSDGILPKEETEVLLCAASNTGPAFVVFVIGGELFLSRSFGWQLYFCQLLSSFIAFILVNRLLFPFKSKKDGKERRSFKNPDLFSAVAGSALSVVTVCGFIVFFSVIGGILIPLVRKLSIPLSGIISATLEFCSGASTAAMIGGSLGRFLCGLSVGFGGISVLCQSASFTSPIGLSAKRLICTKAVQGVICGLLALIPITDASPALDAAIISDTDALFNFPLWGAALPLAAQIIKNTAVLLKTKKTS